MQDYSYPKMCHFGYTVQDLTIPRLITDRAEAYGDKVFLTWLEDGSVYTFRDMHAISDRLARSLQAYGVGPGTHVAVMMENCPEQALTYLALGKVGAVAVPVNTAAKGMLLGRLLRHADVTHAIVEAQFVSRFEEAAADIETICTVVVLEQDGQDARFSDGSRFNAVPFSSLQTSPEASADKPLPVVRYSDLAMLSYTSGTTGPSKANMFHQASVVQFGMTTAESYSYTSDDTIYVCLPLNHANAYLCAFWGAWVAGGSVALARRFSVSRFWHDIRRSKATGTSLLGSMVNMIWALPPTAEDARHNLRFTVLTPMPAFAREWRERYRVEVTTSYGLTDYVLATIYAPGDRLDKLGSAGRPRPGVEIRIADEADNSLPPGEVGEILLRSRNVWSGSMGYYKDPQATLNAIRNMWWHTGDRGYLDEDGYLYFVDRKKDAIRRRGENISAYEVEAIIARHPAVADLAAYPVPSEQSEDEIAISVVLREGESLSARELIEFCIANMAHYMVPRYVQFVADLPRTPTQKVRKEELKVAALQNLAAFWDREREGIQVKR